MSQTTMLQLAELADQMVAIIARWEPEGMMEVVEAYRRWPDVLCRLTDAWAIMHSRAGGDFPLNPAAAQLVEAVTRHQRTTAQAAEEIAPTVVALHRDQIEALSDRRNAMWDHRANRDHAAAPAGPQPAAPTGPNGAGR